MRNYFLIILFFFSTSFSAYSQADTTKINPYRLGIVLASGASVLEALTFMFKILGGVISLHPFILTMVQILDTLEILIKGGTFLVANLLQTFFIII